MTLPDPEVTVVAKMLRAFYPAYRDDFSLMDHRRMVPAAQMLNAFWRANLMTVHIEQPDLALPDIIAVVEERMMRCETK